MNVQIVLSSIEALIWVCCLSVTHVHIYESAYTTPDIGNQSTTQDPDTCPFSSVEVESENSYTLYKT